MGLFTAAERFLSLDRSVVKFESESCLHTQNQFSDCEACFSMCPVSAIQPGSPPSLDSSKCVGCLACLPICPVDAYAADDGVQALLTCIARSETTHIEIVCEKNLNGEHGCSSNNIGIQVHGCLAGLGVGGLIALASMGMESIILRLDGCKDCALGNLRPHIVDQITQAKTLLSVWEKTDILFSVSDLSEIIQRPLWNSKNPPLSRRDLFRLATRQGKIAIAHSIEKTKSGDNHQSGKDRRRIINAISHLSSLEVINDPILTGETYSIIKVSEACTACGVCVRACPTGALQFTTDDEGSYFELDFLAQYCIGCRLCAHTCFPNAIVVENSPRFSQVFGSKEPSHLCQGDLSHCQNCNTVFKARSGVQLCPACDYRKTNPFGSRLPPGIKLPNRDLPKEVQH